MVHLLCDVRGAPWLELEVRTRWIVLFKSYIASYVSPIQTGFLMGLRKSYGGTVIVISVKKNSTGTEYTGIRRIPAGITNLGYSTQMIQACYV